MNSTDNATVICPLHEDRHILSTHPALNAAQLAVGVCVSIINSCFLCLLYRRRKRLQWKRYAFVANVAAADSCGGVALIILAAYSFSFDYTHDHSDHAALHLQLLALYTALSASLSVTVESYDMLILVQYLAIRRPLWYKTLVTQRKMAALLAWIWTINPGYAVLKTYLLMSDNESHWRNLMIYELCFLSVTCLWNTSTYFYVLGVAAIKKSQLHNSRLNGFSQSRSSYSLDLSGVGNGCENGRSPPPPPAVLATVSATVPTVFPTSRSSTSRSNSLPQSRSTSRHSSLPQLANACQDFLRQYRFLATAGLNLIAYWFSIIPLTTVYIYMLFRDQKMYFNEATVKHVAILLWFVRSLCDPLIYMIREKKLRHWSKTNRDVVQVVVTNVHQEKQQRRISQNNTSSLSSLNVNAFDVRQSVV